MQLFRLFNRPSYGFAQRQGLDSLIEGRRKTNDQLKEREEKAKDLQAFWNSPQTDIVIQFVLYMKHDCYQCQTLFALLNYHKISFDKVENILFLDNAKKSNVINIPNWDWPVLKINVSMDPTLFMSGKDNILYYLINKELINNYIQPTVWADQGQQFCIERIQKPLESLFLNPILTWQNLFKSSPEAYNKDAKNYLLISYLFRLAKLAVKQCSINTYTLLKNTEEYKQAQGLLITGIEEWIVRLNNQDYHGGTIPDQADFLMFGTIMSKHNSYSFRKFIENKTPNKFNGWLIRMKQLCRFEADRFYMNTENNQI